MDYSSQYIGIELFLIIITTVSLVCIYEKADYPGWAAFIPFYGLYILLKIVNKPGWWVILYFIPIVDLIVTIIVGINLAKAFGKNTFFGVILLGILTPIGFPILAFGNSKYKIKK